MAAVPDRDFADYVVEGIEEGFRIGFERSDKPTRSAHRNMPSVSAHPQPVTAFLEGEVRAGRMAGPLEREDCPEVNVSGMGVIPKSTPGKWRVIVDLSSPSGASVNDGVDRRYCSMRYASIDDAASMMVRLGPGTELAKIDIAQAYRNVPVHPADRWLLGVNWEGRIFVDKTLPFGLRSAPKIFSALADALEWVLQNEGLTEVLHYLDDFLTMGRPGSGECLRNLRILCEVCERLGLPLAIEKVEGPAVVLVFLGILLDTVRMEMRLPPEKLARLKTMVAEWLGRKKATKRQLLSLIGHLAHAAKVVTPGRTFVRRMIDLAHSKQELSHWIYLNEEFRSDLQWWDLFLDRWNGRSCLATHISATPEVVLVSDASGTWGCGAVWQDRWLQLAWSGDWGEQTITVKELLPIALAVAIWGRQWAGQQVLARCDNSAVVAILRSRTSKHSRVMHLLRSLYFFLAEWDIALRAEHIPGVQNTAADAISRNQLQVFRQVAPGAQDQPAGIPAAVLQLLVEERPDWTSAAWRSRLHTIFNRV